MTRIRFHQELDELKHRILAMAGMSEQAIDLAVQAYSQRDLALCQRVLNNEDAINRAEREVDEFAIDLLAMQQPMAIDLRFILAVIKINADLERVGDQAVNIVQRVMNMIELPAHELPVDIPAMASRVRSMVRDALRSFIEGDTDLAKHVLEADDEIDRMNHEAFANLSSFMQKKPEGEMQARRPALVILDIMVPGNSGLDVARSIRNNSALAGVPIVFVTARTTESDRLRGFEIGADDYITKPFSPKEVVARVRAVLRRFDQPLQKEIVRAGDLVIDTAAMRLTARNDAVVTTATEFRLIEFLASHPGRVFTRKSLLDAVWHDTAFVTPRIVDVYIRRLREKIERDPEKPRHIHTVRGAGYMFEVRR